MNFQECIREVMIQRMLREQPDVETVSVTTADPLFVLPTSTPAVNERAECLQH